MDHAEEHAIRPVVGQVHPFERIRDAHDALESRRSTGKVVLTLDPATALDVWPGDHPALLWPGDNPPACLRHPGLASRAASLLASDTAAARSVPV